MTSAAPNAREILESAAHDLETRHTNLTYKAAWKAAAKLLRAQIPKYEQTANLETAQTP